MRLKATMRWAAGLALGVLLLGAGAARAQGIAGTAHDLSGSGYGSTQICIFCHSPHNVAGTQIVPLWNHATTTQTFQVYASGTLNAAPTQPAGSSKACLSCHDGVTFVDAYGTHAGGNAIGGSANLGTNLSNDHPISFTYDTNLATADGGLATPDNTAGRVGALNLPLYGVTKNQMECASCHAVHTDANHPFLRAANTGSALCRNCHSK